MINYLFFCLHHSPKSMRAIDEKQRRRKTTLLKWSLPAFVFHHHAIPKPYITIQDTCYMSHRLLQARITSADCTKASRSMTSPEMKLLVVGSIGWEACPPRSAPKIHLVSSRLLISPLDPTVWSCPDVLESKTRSLTWTSATRKRRSRQSQRNRLSLSAVAENVD